MTITHDFEPVPTADEFGARLALIRWKKGWNQKEAALACGLPHASWRQWELIGSSPRNFVDVATKISAATGYDDYWIMTGRERSGGPDGGGGVRRQGLEPRTRWLREAPSQTRVLAAVA